MQNHALAYRSGLIGFKSSFETICRLFYIYFFGNKIKQRYFFQEYFLTMLTVKKIRNHSRSTLLRVLKIQIDVGFFFLHKNSSSASRAPLRSLKCLCLNISSAKDRTNVRILKTTIFRSSWSQ